MTAQVDNELVPYSEMPGILGQFITWTGEKAKYSVEAFANLSAIASQVPKIFGGNQINALYTSRNEAGYENTAYAKFGTAKKLLALPSVIKAAPQLYTTLTEGRKSLRDIAGEVCYFIGDSIDSLSAMKSFGIFNLSDSNFLWKKVLAPIKDLTGFIGLSNSAYNLTEKMSQLKAKDVTVAPMQGVANAQEKAAVATECRRNMVDAQVNNMWWDRFRDITAIAMCSIGLVCFYLVDSRVWCCSRDSFESLVLCSIVVCGCSRKGFNAL